MDRKKNITAIITVITIVAVFGLYTLMYNANCTSIMPDVQGLSVHEALEKCEELNITDEDDPSKYIVKDAETDERIEENYAEYFVIKQSPEAGSRFIYKDGLLPKHTRITDILVLEVSSSSNK